MSISPADCPDASVHGNPFRYCPSCSWIEPAPKVTRPATVGSIVHYRITEGDRRTIISRRQQNNIPGNVPGIGELYPAVIVRVWGPNSANLQVLLDGPDTHWATSRTEGDAEGQWSWPEYLPRDGGVRPSQRRTPPRCITAGPGTTHPQSAWAAGRGAGVRTVTERSQESHSPLTVALSQATIQGNGQERHPCEPQTCGNGQ